MIHIHTFLQQMRFFWTFEGGLEDGIDLFTKYKIRFVVPGTSNFLYFAEFAPYLAVTKFDRLTSYCRKKWQNISFYSTLDSPPKGMNGRYSKKYEYDSRWVQLIYIFFVHMKALLMILQGWDLEGHLYRFCNFSIEQCIATSFTIQSIKQVVLQKEPF